MLMQGAFMTGIAVHWMRCVRTFTCPMSTSP